MHQKHLALGLLKKVDAESLGPPPKFQVNIKIQLNASRVSRQSFRSLWLCHFLKKGIFTFSCIYDPAYRRETDQIVTRVKEATKIVRRKDEVDDIISFFYNAFKGEGARKLFPRIRRHYTGISIKRIQKWLNSNEDHFKTNPIFSNKPHLTPVISKNDRSDRSSWYEGNGSFDQRYSI